MKKPVLMRVSLLGMVIGEKIEDALIFSNKNEF